jgi:hypothetical protein
MMSRSQWPRKAHAHTSVRNLNRRFRAETGLSPLQWLLHQRVDRARELLESTTLPMDQVARLSGLRSSESLRQRFVRRVGLTPSAYRSGFTRTPEPGPPTPDPGPSGHAQPAVAQARSSSRSVGEGGPGGTARQVCAVSPSRGRNATRRTVSWAAAEA